MNNDKQGRSGSGSAEIAGRIFHSSDYDETTQLEKGLAETHEQIGDDYFEGTADKLLGAEKE
nr:YozQ family protein [Peribacillus kribbensis]